MKEWICEEVSAVTIDGKPISTMLHKTHELVRCKDCKHFSPMDSRCFKKYNPCFGRSTNPDGFCSDGEKKEGWD